MKELTLWHIRILQTLADDGPSPLSRFNETFCDDLFRLRPRLVQLVKGHEEPILDITAEGRQRLTGAFGSTAMNKRRAAAV
jgi:hypothetical protein